MWSPQIIDCSKPIKGHNSICFIDIELKHGVVVAESHTQHILQALHIA